MGRRRRQKGKPASSVTEKNASTGISTMTKVALALAALSAIGLVYEINRRRTIAQESTKKLAQGPAPDTLVHANVPKGVPTDIFNTATPTILIFSKDKEQVKATLLMAIQKLQTVGITSVLAGTTKMIWGSAEEIQELKKRIETLLAQGPDRLLLRFSVLLLELVNEQKVTIEDIKKAVDNTARLFSYGSAGTWTASGVNTLSSLLGSDIDIDSISRPILMMLREMQKTFQSDWDTEKKTAEKFAHHMFRQRHPPPPMMMMHYSKPGPRPRPRPPLGW